MFNEEGPLRRIPLPMALVLLMKFLLSILKITNEDRSGFCRTNLGQVIGMVA